MNTTFIDACFSKSTKYTPVWYMRQAGRYLPQYRKLKGKKNILDIIKNPELAALIALSPIGVLGVDAAILYADIMVPLLGVGMDVEIIENIGPVVKNPVRSIKDIKKIRTLEPSEDIPYLIKTIKILRKELSEKVPLIGFSAAPFTLASYILEGKPSRDFLKTKSLMYGNKKLWNALLEKLSDIIISYLSLQINSGVQAIQLFDSWVGSLSEEDYKEYVLPHSQRIFKSLKYSNVALIHFGTNTSGMLRSFSSVDCHVVSVDWRMSLDKAWSQIGEKGIQGNLDPVVVLSDFSSIKKRVDKIFSSFQKRNGYIFNLGHGILPNTPVDNLKRLTEYVHNL